MSGSLTEKGRLKSPSTCSDLIRCGFAGNVGSLESRDSRRSGETYHAERGSQNSIPGKVTGLSFDTNLTAGYCLVAGNRVTDK